jgi:hypothetical protein
MSSALAGSVHPSARPLPGACLPASDGPRPRLPARSEDRATCSLRRHPARGTARSDLVVSHHLAGFLRALVAGLLHPATGHGVHRVWRAPALTSPRTSPPFHQISGRLPHDERPFGAFPSSAAGPCHHALLPSCRYRSALADPTPAGVGHAHRRVFRSSVPALMRARLAVPRRGPPKLCAHVSRRPVSG